jgi:hypothetical protein
VNRFFFMDSSQVSGSHSLKICLDPVRGGQVTVKHAIRGSNEEALAIALAGKYADKEREWSVGGFEEWIQETNELGRSFAYGHAPGFECGKDFSSSELTVDYVAQANDIALVQLSKSGVRLVHILNRAFGY